MSSRPWYKRYGGDFVLGTMSLSLEEKGAYSLCLDLIYDRGGPILDDARWLAGICGVSLRKWASLRSRLIETGKLTAVDGHLTNQRAGKEIAASHAESREHVENGSKGGRKRAENASKTVPNDPEPTDGTPENNEIAQAGLKPNQKPEARDTVPNGTGAEAPPPDLRKEAFDAALAVLMDLGGMRRNGAAGFLGKLQKDFDLSPEELLGIAEAVKRIGSPDPAAYVRKAAAGVAERRSGHGADRDPMLFPSEERQRMWMEEFRERKSSWSGNRGPRPGEYGCRVSPEIQRRFAIEPFGDARPPAPDLLALAGPGRRVA